jgi:hypothetical protein
VVLRQVGPLAEDAVLGRIAGERERSGATAISAAPPNAGMSSAASSPASRPVPRVPTAVSSPIKAALPTAFPYQADFTDLAGRIAKLPP